MKNLIHHIESWYRLYKWRKKLCRSFPEPQAYMAKILEIELDAYGQGYVDGLTEKQHKFLASSHASPFVRRAN